MSLTGRLPTFVALRSRLRKARLATFYFQFNPTNPTTINDIDTICTVVSLSLNMSMPSRVTNTVLAPAHKAFATPAGNDFSVSVKKTKLSAYVTIAAAV